MAPPDRRLEAADEQGAVAQVADPARLVERAELEATSCHGADEDESVAELEPLVLPRRVGPQDEGAVRADPVAVDGARFRDHHDAAERELGDGPRRELDRRGPGVAQLVAQLHDGAGRVEADLDRPDEPGLRFGQAGEPDTAGHGLQDETVGVGHRDPFGVLRREPQPMAAEQLVPPGRGLPAVVRRLGQEVVGRAGQAEPHDPRSGGRQHLHPHPVAVEATRGPAVIPALAGARGGGSGGGHRDAGGIVPS